MHTESTQNPSKDERNVHKIRRINLIFVSRRRTVQMGSEKAVVPVVRPVEPLQAEVPLGRSGSTAESGSAELKNGYNPILNLDAIFLISTTHTQQRRL